MRLVFTGRKWTKENHGLKSEITSELKKNLRRMILVTFPKSVFQFNQILQITTKMLPLLWVKKRLGKEILIWLFYVLYCLKVIQKNFNIRHITFLVLILKVFSGLVPKLHSLLRKKAHEWTEWHWVDWHVTVWYLFLFQINALRTNV